MAFWSGEKLRQELPHLISDYRADQIDCASYRLRLGEEVYVTPVAEAAGGSGPTKSYLKRIGSPCIIPPGQFAFLLTEEVVSVPADAIGFISMRSKVKFRGLVNVSGFHVDPGYTGKLIFSVFNAGPSPIHLARGDDWFVIWYADLDRLSKDVKSGQGLETISSDLINPIAGQLQSMEGLESRISENEKKLSDRISTIERDHAVVKWATALLLGAVIAFGIKQCGVDNSSKNDSWRLTPASSVSR